MVYLAASGGRGGPTPVRLTLVGVAFTAVLAGISQTLALIDTDTFDRMRFWGAGTITDRPAGTVGDILPFVLAGLVAAALCARPLNAIALGDDAGRAVGLRVGAVRSGVVIAVALLCGAATAAAGPLMFVGLMVPHAVRWLHRPRLALDPRLLGRPRPGHRAGR
ncbi:iron chelate uptake ABC transporter family permease subunit [Streptomyces californicus]